MKGLEKKRKEKANLKGNLRSLLKQGKRVVTEHKNQLKDITEFSDERNGKENLNSFLKKPKIVVNGALVIS